MCERSCVRADAVCCGHGGLARCHCVTIVTLYAERGQQQRRRCCVACGYLSNFPPATAVGCPVAVFASFAVAVALATAYDSM